MTIPEILAAFNRLKVLIVGDIMLDSYIWGKVERISPEAPVPVVVAQRKEFRLGGAGNVVLNVNALGAEALICSVTGQDGYGDRLLDILREHGLSCDGIVRSAERLTTVKERVIAGSQQIVRVDTETDLPISEPDRQELLERIKTLANDADVLIFEDYDKGVLNAETIAEVIAFAQSRGIPTVVDPKKRNFLHYRGATLFKPNLKELREGLGISFNAAHAAELEEAVERLKQALQVQGTLITLSERGVFIDFQEEKHHIPAHIRQIADVSGAGDTVISIAACALALRLPPARLAGLANLGGGLVCESIGVVPINKKQLEEEAQREEI